MKSFLKKLVLRMLVKLARVRLKRLRPFIIGVTGSVGKTSTKDAVYTLLNSRYHTVRNEKSYNTEFGLPLAILEQNSGFSSPLEWLQVLVKGFFKAFFGGKNLQMMVLEMGVDKPGDMNDLLKLVHPQIAVFTNVKPVHLAEGQFKDLDDIFTEKSRLIAVLPEKGTAVLNADDPYAVALRDQFVCKKILYGASEIADLRVLGLTAAADGISFTISYRDEVIDGHLPLVGAFQIYVILPALAVGLTQGFSLSESLEILKNYKTPPGRMSVIEGIQNTTILDSTYNASPSATKEALSLLREIAKGRKIAVLGNMNELGAMSDQYHREVGKHAVGRADILVTVGELAEQIAEEAQKEGFPVQDIYRFKETADAEKVLKNILQQGDTILVKGSQNRVRLERLVKALMADPAKAKDLLVRQEKHWDHIQ